MHKYVVFLTPNAVAVPVNQYGRTQLSVGNYVNPEDNPDLVEDRHYKFFYPEKMISGDLVYVAGHPLVYKPADAGKLSFTMVDPQELTPKKEYTTVVTYGTKQTLVLNHPYSWVGTELDLTGAPELVHIPTGVRHSLKIFGTYESELDFFSLAREEVYRRKLMIFENTRLVKIVEEKDIAEHLAYYIDPR